MPDPVGFWSYARLDDEHSDGQLSQLRAVVGNAIGMQYGDRVTLWQDIQAIPYGADWAATIEETIGKTTFFIPIVTPRFLKSANCRDEYLSFRRRMSALRRDDLIFPVHYVNVEDLRPEDTVFGDHLAALRRAQWIDFRPLFYADPKSAEARRWAGDFAGGILRTVRREAPRSGVGNSRDRAASPSAADADDARPINDAPAQAPISPPVTPQYEKSRVTRIAGALAMAGLFILFAASFAWRGPEIFASSRPPPSTTVACGAGLGPRAIGVLSAAEECELKPKDAFQECKDCPEMVVVPAGDFTMGSPDSEDGKMKAEEGRYNDEGPRHRVAITHAFAAAIRDVTFSEWDACVAVDGCPKAEDSFFSRQNKPVINVSFDAAEHYAAWLSSVTGKTYRLLSEAEWEYSARAGTTTAYYWGEQISYGRANCDGCGSQWDSKLTSPVGSFAPNAFGLYDMAGDVWQWTMDCYQDTYRFSSSNAAPSDGSAWTAGNCQHRVFRGGAWDSSPRELRSAMRGGTAPDDRRNNLGFRVARTLAP